jgi:hypothetical protein
VAIRYRDIPVLDWVIYALRGPRADIALNSTVDWDIVFNDGVKNLDADLRLVI